jgi:large subunit ribosomal protein L27
MATKLAAGSCRQYRDPRPKFYGIKLSNGSFAIEGSIILKQKGNKFYAGKNVVQGRDFSLNATQCGTVIFHKEVKKTTMKKVGKKTIRTYVSVI